MIPSATDALVLRQARTDVQNLAPAATDLKRPIVVVDVGEKKIGTFKIGEGTYGLFLEPATMDEL